MLPSETKLARANEEIALLAKQVGAGRSEVAQLKGGHGYVAILSFSVDTLKVGKLDALATERGATSKGRVFFFERTQMHSFDPETAVLDLRSALRQECNLRI